MSKTLHLAEGPRAALSESFIHLEDDILDPLWMLTLADKPPAAWALFHDNYGDATFDPERARVLAVECVELAGKAEPVLALWLLTIAAFAEAAGRCGKYVVAFAD